MRLLRGALVGAVAASMLVAASFEFAATGAAATSGAGAFTATTPFRTSGSGAPVTIGEAQTATVPIAGTGGVPADASAVVVNATVASATADTFVTVFPSGTGLSTSTSSVNAKPGENVANLVQVALGANGAIDVYNNRGTTGVYLDVTGYFGGTSESGFTPLSTPTRILDTRTTGQRLTGGASLTFAVAGRAGVPSDASAVVMNVTAVGLSGIGPSFLTVWPGGQQRPLASNINMVPGHDVANLVTVGLGNDGSVLAYNNAGSVDVVADVVGYYSPSGTLVFTGLAPGRLLDTRSGIGRASGQIGPGASADVPATYFGVPADASAVVTHATAVNGTAGANYVTAFPAGQSVPTASTLNPAGAGAVANLSLTRLGSGGAIGLFNAQGSTDLIVDVSGYYSTVYGQPAARSEPPVYPPSNPPAGATLTCSASMTNSTPVKYTNDQVIVQTGVSGAAVSATAHYKTTNTTETGTADGSGVATLTFGIGNATSGRPVPVTVDVAGAGQTASCSTAFTPV